MVLTYCTVTRLAGNVAQAQALMLQPAQAGAQQPAQAGAGGKGKLIGENSGEKREMDGGLVVPVLDQFLDGGGATRQRSTRGLGKAGARRGW